MSWSPEHMVFTSDLDGVGTLQRQALPGEAEGRSEEGGTVAGQVLTATVCLEPGENASEA